MHQELNEGHALVRCDFGHQAIVQNAQTPITWQGSAMALRNVAKTCKNDIKE